MITKRSILMLLVLLVPAGLALAADEPVSCAVVPGDYVINLSGFGGGAPVFYPIALVGKMSVEKDGDVTGTYKQHAPMFNGVTTKNFTGTLKISKDCSGSLTVKDGARITHTFNVYMGEGNVLTMAMGDVGTVLSGRAEP